MEGGSAAHPTRNFTHNTEKGSVIAVNRERQKENNEPDSRLHQQSEREQAFFFFYTCTLAGKNQYFACCFCAFLGLFVVCVYVASNQSQLEDVL